MKYMITFPLTHHAYKERISRFMEAGAPPPEGVTIVGRWFTAGHNRGYMVVESEEHKTLFRFASEWSDIVDFSIEPLVTVEEAASVLQEMT